MIRDTQSHGCPHLGWLTGRVGTPSRGTNCRCALISQGLTAGTAPVKGMLGRGCHGPAACACLPSWFWGNFGVLGSVSPWSGAGLVLGKCWSPVQHRSVTLHQHRSPELHPHLTQHQPVSKRWSQVPPVEASLPVHHLFPVSPQHTISAQVPASHTFSSLQASTGWRGRPGRALRWSRRRCPRRRSGRQRLAL